MSVCLLVRLSTTILALYRLRGGLRAIPTDSVLQGHEKQRGDFSETTVFETYGVKRGLASFPGLLPPFLPPPHLIITRNAHGAEEAEGLGTRLKGICIHVQRCSNTHEHAASM